MEVLLVFFGSALVAAIAVGGVIRLVLRRTGTPRRRARGVALVAAAAAFATWLVFAFDWLNYALSENGPSYYAFSDYLQYREAVEGLSGFAIGLGYAILSGALVAGASLLPSRDGSWWLFAAVLAAPGAIALPALVPAALPRAEYGKDPVFYLSRGGPYEDPVTGRTTLCFAYGVQRSGLASETGESDAELCLELRRAPARDAYDIGTELNESSIRPYGPVDGLDIEGLEIRRAAWTGVGPPLAEPQTISPPTPEPPVRDAETKKRVLRLAAHMRACHRRERDYVPCAAPDRLRRAGFPFGAVRVEAVSQDGYTVVGESARGNSFTLRHERPRSRLRFCVRRGTGGCPASGRW